jgi:hypothetical protein
VARRRRHSHRRWSDASVHRTSDRGPRSRCGIWAWESKVDGARGRPMRGPAAGRGGSDVEEAYWMTR